MATASASPTPMGNGTHRGKSQIHWSESVWQALDHAVLHELMRTRVAAKFLPHVHVDKKQTTVAADVVIVPRPGGAAGGPFDPSLSVDESATNRINEYWVQFRLTPAQTEAEAHADLAIAHPNASHLMDAGHPEHPAPEGQHQEHGGHYAMPKLEGYRASTAVSLAMRAANVLAQAEDLVLFNGQNAVANSPLFTSGTVQALDPNLVNNLDLGLLNIDPAGTIHLPGLQVVQIHPSAAGPVYRENTLNGVASAISVLQGLGHYEHYALTLQTVPYADLHQALPTTLIEPVEPISHLIKAGVHGTGTLPPFTPAGKGLPVAIQDGTVINGNVLFTGVVASLSGNTMDHVRGKMDEHLDAVVTFNQKDVNENYRFRVVERFALRLKDPSAVVLLLFLDK